MRSIRTLMLRNRSDANLDEFIGYLSKNIQNSGAGDGLRTRDPELGKLVLYQLSYTRIAVRVSADTGLANTLFCYFLFARNVPKLLP